ncbi:hypothetical protein YC2023_102460 [Brassica napus]|uniref:Reverse transcriptase zinc-binding domain-containing protein n=1 Tax=Brassica oleracea TaxID=3712 RepID=A0A3P6FY99_BRAOL|nr:unnamed protein product [Brassica oleracea]
MHLGRAIGDGESTKVWSDAWICPKLDIRPHGPPLQQDQDLMVVDLLLRETKEWNKALVDKLLLEVASHILSLRPNIKGTKYFYIWTQQESSLQLSISMKNLPPTGTSSN